MTASAVIAKPPSARIVKMRSPSSIEVLMWLCPDHREELEKAGWTFMDSVEPPHHLHCQVCDVRPAG